MAFFFIAMEALKKDQSLCPRIVSGIPIDASHYNSMKSQLYQWLTQCHIIPSTQTDLRNIINRQAMTTDGYCVLNDIMVRIHPAALNADNLFLTPIPTNYSDIHEYYTYMNSFIMYAKFAGRVYKPREQLFHFLRGLDHSFAPAVSRIRRQLDNWATNDPNVPDNLQLSNLPDLVEQYMDKDAGDTNNAIVRRIEKGEKGFANHKHRDRESNSKSDETTHQYINTKCPLSQCFGHYKQNCDRMALWLHLKNNSKQVDDKLKVKLHANFAEIDNKRRTKVAKLKGTVHQLYLAGQFEGGEKLLNSTISSFTKCDGSESDSSKSTSS